MAVINLGPLYHNESTAGADASVEVHGAKTNS